MGKLSEKQLFVVFFLAVFIVSCAFGALIFLETRKIKSKRQQMHAVQEELDGYRKKEREIPLIERDLTLMRLRNPENRIALPHQRLDDALLKGIQAQAKTSRVKITGCDFLGKKAAARPGRPPQHPWDTFRIEIRVEGRFFDLLTFLQRLEHYPRTLSLMKGELAKPGGKPPAPGAVGSDDSAGPWLSLRLEMDAFTSLEPPASRQHPRSKQIRKPSPNRAEGPVFQTIQIPEADQLILRDRRDPFRIWLERKPKAHPGQKEPAIPSKPDEIEALMAAWRERLKEILNTEIDGDPEAVYLKWKALVAEVRRTPLPTAYGAERERILNTLLEENRVRHIRERFEAHLEKQIRERLQQIRDAELAGDRAAVLEGFLGLLTKLGVSERLPRRARGDVQTAMDIALKVVEKDLEENAYKEALSRLKAMDAGLRGNWRKTHLAQTFLKNLAAYRSKAEALGEFAKIGLRVSGLFWFPDDAGKVRIAIVNDRAVLEGERVPPPAMKDVRKRLPSAPVTLVFVGQDRFVHFKYKGLRIKVALGNRKVRR
ncbi:MAG: hypothetical protein ACYTHM_06685 [Planctomycetota bacterium]|jgi:hypothetical protein